MNQEPPSTPAPRAKEPRRHPSIGVYRRIATVFVVLTLGMLGFAAYIVFSRADVVVLSEPTDVAGDFIVDVAADPGDGEVKGAVYQEEKEVTQTFPAASVVTIETHAEGKVRIVSTLYRPQTLIASTRLLTPDGILYRLKDRVVVPAFGSVEAEAFADEPGTDNAVGDATFTIPGLNEDTRRFFEVETVDPIEGGQTEVRMLTDSDIEKAKGVMTEGVKNELTDGFRAKAKEDGVDGGKESISFELTDFSVDAKAGDEVDEYTATARVRGTAVFYDGDGFMTEVRKSLQDRLPFDKKLKDVSSKGLDVTLEKVDVIGERANLRVHAAGSATISPDAPLLDPEKITGVSVDAAVQYLEQIDGVSSASVRVRPFWAGRLPDVPENISVEVR